MQLFGRAKFLTEKENRKGKVKFTKDLIKYKLDVYGKHQTANEVFDFIYNSIITAFTPVLKYIKQLLNLWYLAMI
jgi:hypothetical protein